MSAEIVVGACYRDARDGEIVRVTDASDPLAPRCVVVVASGHHYDDGAAGYETWREWPRDRWERVADPTPAVIDDAEPPLAGELTLRQLAAWAVAQDYDGCPRISLIRIGGEWIVTMTSIRALNVPIEQRQERGADIQDALTALMSEAR